MMASDDQGSITEIHVTDVDEGDSHSMPGVRPRSRKSARRNTMPAHQMVSLNMDSNSDHGSDIMSDGYMEVDGYVSDGQCSMEEASTSYPRATWWQSVGFDANSSSCLECDSSPLAETIGILLSLQEDLFPGAAKPPSSCVTRNHPPPERLQWCIANLAELAVKEYADYEIQQLAQQRLDEMQQNEEIDENIFRWVQGAYSSRRRSRIQTTSPRPNSSGKTATSPSTPLLRMSASHVRLSSLMEDEEDRALQDPEVSAKSCPQSPEPQRRSSITGDSSKSSFLSLLTKSHSFHDLAHQHIKAEEWSRPTSSEGRRSKPNSSSGIVRIKSTPNIAQQASGLLELSQECKDMLRGGLNSWSFDIFQFDVVSGYRPLTVMTVAICRKRKLLQALNVHQATLCRFMARIEDEYGRFPHVPYHSNVHGADVAQSVHIMLSATRLQGVFTELELFAAIISAACHDVGHPGVNNQFLQATWSPLAILYNNKSVLENHHLSITFRTLMEEEFNILANLNAAKKNTFRELVIEMVLGTDTMTKHATHLSSLHSITEKQRTIHSAPNASLHLDDDDKVAVLKTMVHCADLANPAKPWNLAKVWSERIVTEFFQQGDQERKLELEVGPVNDRNKVKLAASQLGFIDFLAQPMWEAWEDLIGEHDSAFMRNLTVNRARWQQLKNKDAGTRERPRADNRGSTTRWNSLRTNHALSSGLRVLQAARTRRSFDVGRRLPEQQSGRASMSPFSARVNRSPLRPPAPLMGHEGPLGRTTPEAEEA